MNSIHSTFVFNLLAYFLHIFKWAYFIVALLKQEEVILPLKNRKCIISENKVQLKQVRNVISLSRKTEMILRALWLLSGSR